jgi:Cysteine-rich CWC
MLHLSDVNIGLPSIRFHVGFMSEVPITSFAKFSRGQYLAVSQSSATSTGFLFRQFAYMRDSLSTYGFSCVADDRYDLDTRRAVSESSMSDNQKCSLCGQPNRCAMTEGQSVSACWCASIRLTEDMLEAVPTEDRGVRCICARCARELSQLTPPAPQSRTPARRPKETFDLISGHRHLKWNHNDEKSNSYVTFYFEECL